MSSHTEANYNKFTGQGKGILVGNWAEERALREFTNVGRTIVKEHIPKKHLNFEDPITAPKAFDNTSQRIYGEKHETPFFSETYSIGKSTNPADQLPKLGQKTKNIEAEILAQVNEEMAAKERQVYEETQRRYFTTTTGDTHAKMDYQQNTVGRKVMRTQDGKAVSFNERDEQLIVEHGTWRRLQKQPDEELWQKIPKGAYEQQQPITHWTHTLDRKNFYMSADVGPNPFAKTSGFTQTVDQVKSVSGYWGNVDFEQAQKRNEFRKSTGTDLNLGNPYIVQEVPVNNLQDIAARIIAACKNKAPANGLRALRVALRAIEQNGLVEPVAFKFALRQFGIEISEEEGKALLKNFDPMRTGLVSVNELFHVIRSPSWTAAREQMVEAAYSRLDVRGNQTVTIECLERGYDVTPNPEYQAGTKTGQQLMNEFLAAWDTHARDGVISLAEFVDFYKDVSPTIFADKVFGNMIQNTWGL